MRLPVRAARGGLSEFPSGDYPALLELMIGRHRLAPKPVRARLGGEMPARTQVLFIHGGGPGVHDEWNARLAESLIDAPRRWP